MPQLRPVRSAACSSLSFGIDRIPLRLPPPTPGTSAQRDHALDRTARAGGDLGLDRDLVLPVAERVAQLLERDHLHVLAERPLRDGLAALPGRPLVGRVEGGGLA